MRKMIVMLNVRLEIDAEEGVELSDIINELDYSFDYPVTSGYNSATIQDTNIEDYELVDSK
jgi:hypothetical protein